MTTPTSSAFRQLLDTAYALGHTDGRLAVALELPEPPGVTSTTCRGRDPEHFARWLWRPRPGPPPSGLAASAPHWYAQGFRDARADAGSVPAEPTARPTAQKGPCCSSPSGVTASFTRVLVEGLTAVRGRRHRRRWSWRTRVNAALTTAFGVAPLP